MPKLIAVLAALVATFIVAPANGSTVGDYSTTAHRGYHANGVTENTLKSIALASKHGATAVEIDMQLTKDGRMVILHDDHFGRTTRTGGNVMVDSVTAKWVRNNVRSNDGQRLPFAKSALDMAKRHHINVLLEVKANSGWGTDQFIRLANVITDAGMWNRVIIISFDGKALHVAKETDARFRTGLIARSVVTKSELDYVLPDVVSYRATEMTTASVAMLRENGIGLMGRHADTLIEWREYDRRGVIGTITDEPSRHASR